MFEQKSWEFKYAYLLVNQGNFNMKNKFIVDQNMLFILTPSSNILIENIQNGMWNVKAERLDEKISNLFFVIVEDNHTYERYDDVTYTADIISILTKTLEPESTTASFLSELTENERGELFLVEEGVIFVDGFDQTFEIYVSKNDNDYINGLLISFQDSDQYTQEDWSEYSD